jgi:heme a synthase
VKETIKSPQMYRWALLATAFCVVVVVLGAFTRLVDAGLGCPDWPGCYGHLTWPKTEEAIARAEAAFPDFPVELDKTWPEMVHRYAAGILGLMIMGLTIATWRRAKRDPEHSYPLKLALGLLVLVIVQGLFGKWTVTLKLWPQVVTAHLLGGFATLSLLWLLSQRYSGHRWKLPSNSVRRLRGLTSLLWLAFIVVVAQIALGGWVSANYAALACTDFPKCNNQWWPNMDFRQGFNFAQDVGPNYLGGLLESEARKAIHVTHRLGALIVTLVVGLLCWRLWQINHRSPRRMALVIAGVLAVQIALGVTNIVASLPLAVAVAHNAGGALLLLTLVTLAHRTYTAQRH